MAEKRASRKTRFDFFKNFFAFYEAGHMTEDAAKENVALTGHVIYKSELPKFAEAYPDVQMDKFEEYLINVGALKSGGRVLSGKGGSGAKLASLEKFQSMGGNEADYPAYKQAVEAVYAQKKVLADLIPDKTYAASFAITKHKEKVPKAKTP